PHREVEFAIDVYFAKKNEYRPLRQVSPVIDALATTQFDDWVKRVRVFVAPKWRDLLESVNLEELLLETIESPEIKE
ncbi:metal-dependent phosphohydrolase, partial [bacterium]|nr:metal-dependent phosphohydrolase [bacterium]